MHACEIFIKIYGNMTVIVHIIFDVRKFFDVSVCTGKVEACTVVHSNCEAHHVSI